jgi:hypothetical protein
VSELRDRYSLRELIIIVLTIGLVVTLVLAVILLGVSKLLHPELDTGSAVATVGQLINVLVGVVVGYLAGRPSEPRE